MASFAEEQPGPQLDDNKYFLLELQLIDIEESINYSIKAIPPLRENYLRCMQVFFNCEEFFQGEELQPIHKVLKKMHGCLTMIFTRLMEVCDSMEEEKKILQSHFDSKTKEYTIKKLAEQRNFRLGMEGDKPKLRRMGGTVLSEDADRGIEGGRRKLLTLNQEIEQFVEEDTKLIDEIESYMAHQHEILNTMNRDNLGVKLYRILEYFKDCQESVMAFMNSKEWQGEPLPEFNLDEVLKVCDASNKRLKTKLAKKAAETINKHVNQALEKQNEKNPKQQNSHNAINPNQNHINTKISQQIYAAVEQSLARKSIGSRGRNTVDSRRGSRRASKISNMSYSEDQQSLLSNADNKEIKGPEIPIQIINSQINKAINLEINRAMNDQLKNMRFEGVPNISQELKKLVRSVMSRLGINIKEISHDAPRRSSIISLSRRSSRISLPRESISRGSELSNKFFQQISRIANANQNQNRVSKQEQSNERSYEAGNSKFTFRTSFEKYPKINTSEYHRNMNPIISQQTQDKTPPQEQPKWRLLRKQSKFKINLPPNLANFVNRQDQIDTQNQTPTIEEEENSENKIMEDSSSDSESLTNSKESFQNNPPKLQKKSSKASQRAQVDRTSIKRDDMIENSQQRPSNSESHNLVTTSNSKLMRSSATPELSSGRQPLNTLTNGSNGPNGTNGPDGSVGNSMQRMNEMYRKRATMDNRADTLISIKRERIGTGATATPQKPQSSSIDSKYHSTLQTQICKNQMNLYEATNFNLKAIVQNIKTLGVLYRKYKNATPSKQLKYILKQLSIGTDVFTYSNLINHLQMDIESHLSECYEQPCMHLKAFEDVLAQNIKSFEKAAPKALSRSNVRVSEIFR